MSAFKQKPRFSICLIFTHGVSLEQWDRLGILDREIKPYKTMVETGETLVTFLTYGGTNDLRYAKSLGGIEVLPAFRSSSPPSSHILKILAGFLSLWRFRKTLQKINIFKSNQMLGSHLAWICANLFHAKSLIRTGYEFYDFAQKRKLKKKFHVLAWIISYCSYKIADMVVVSSEADRIVAMQNFNVPLEKIEIQPNWIDTDLFSPAAQIDAPKRDLITVGRLDPQKNLFKLLQAVKKANCSLDIVGAGPLNEDLKSFAKKLNADVRFLGSFANKQLPVLFTNYKAFILCSKFEGNPKALLEAMSCGMPVIGSRAPGVEAVISNDLTGLVCEPRVETIANAISAILTSRARAKNLGKNARQAIENENSLEQFLKNEFSRYQRLLLKTERF